MKLKLQSAEPYYWALLEIGAETQVGQRPKIKHSGGIYSRTWSIHNTSITAHSSVEKQIELL